MTVSKGPKQGLEDSWRAEVADAINELAGDDQEAKVNRSGDTMIGALAIDTPASSGNQFLSFPEGYSVYADNVGPGSDTSRLWINGPDGGAVYVGPRAGSSLLELVDLRAENVTTEGHYVTEAWGGVSRRVVDTGVNDNGEWTKFADGTMICWRNHSVTDQAIPHQYGPLYLGSRNYTFPVAFTSTPVVTMGECHWGTAAPWGTSIYASLTGFTARFFDIRPRAAGTSMGISWTAIGRWS